MGLSKGALKPFKQLLSAMIDKVVSWLHMKLHWLSKELQSIQQ
jgi:hypothetical protein